MTPDLLSPKHVANPFPLYQELRRSSPVFFYPPLNSWILCRHADVVTAYSDKRLSAERAQGLVEIQVPGSGDLLADFVRVLRKTCLMSDPPYHTKARRVAQLGFTPQAVETYRRMVQEEVRDLIDKLPQNQTVDLVSEFATPFPSQVIARLMGVPTAMREAFRDWTLLATRLFGSAQLTREAALEGQQAVLDMLRFIEELAIEKRKRPVDDVMSRIVAATDTGLQDSEVAILCLEIIGAAHNTTLDFLSNALHALGTYPNWLSTVREDPAKASAVGEELLRFSGPILFMNRFATDNLVIGGQQIERGQLVTMLLASANRDPEVFDSPETFDPSRGNAGKHVSFAWGSHYCLGAPLARLEIEVVLQELSTRFGALNLDPRPLKFRPRIQMRGLEELFATLSPL